MSDKPLDFDSVIRWLSRGDPLPYEPSAIAILRAATGLTLSEALARLKGDTLTRVIENATMYGEGTAKMELYPSTWPTDTEVARECLDHMKADPRATEPVVPPGMVSVEDVVEVVSRYQLLDDAQTDGLIDRIRSLAAPAQKEEGNG